MSNQVIFYTQIGSIILFVSTLFILYRLLVQQKDATIEVLREKNTWLKEQVDQAKDNAPDIVAERLKARVGQFKEELEQLSKDYEANKVLIQQKEKELERAQELLGDLEYYKEQFGCPICGAELITLAGEDVEYRAYACGNTSGQNMDYPCPHDPDFPKLDEYDFDIRVDKGDGAFISKPKPTTKNAHKLTLQFQSGATEEEVRRKIQQNYDRHKRKP